MNVILILTRENLLRRNMLETPLLLGATAAKAFDHHPEKQTLSCMLLGDVPVKQVDFATSDTRTLCEIMRDKWLSAPEFDKLRDADEFGKIMNTLH